MPSCLVVEVQALRPGFVLYHEHRVQLGQRGLTTCIHSTNQVLSSNAHRRHHYLSGGGTWYGCQHLKSPASCAYRYNIIVCFNLRRQRTVDSRVLVHGSDSE